jgi:addiction module RelE/StbE family toxin
VTVRWSEFAIEDLRRIYDYIAQDNSKAAADVIAGIFDAGDALAEHPRLGRYDKTRNVRELVHTPYLIIYEIEEDLIDILAVFDGRRRR